MTSTSGAGNTSAFMGGTTEIPKTQGNIELQDMDLCFRDKKVIEHSYAPLVSYQRRDPERSIVTSFNHLDSDSIEMHYHELILYDTHPSQGGGPEIPYDIDIFYVHNVEHGRRHFRMIKLGDVQQWNAAINDMQYWIKYRSSVPQMDLYIVRRGGTPEKFAEE